MNILVTGASGFIGSHTCIALLQAQHSVIALDNLCNSSRESIARVERLTGSRIPFVELDVRDADGLEKLFRDRDVDAVIHFAGLKAVGDSVKDPIRYYDNNVIGTLRLLDAMEQANVRRIIFSSSATVYNTILPSPLRETTQLAPANPYGRSKLMAEQMISDMCVAKRKWRAVMLRYFNPVGAHESGMLGEDPSGVPNNLMPSLTQVAVGKLAKLSVFGNDHDTPDGTGVRDYLHVMDLAEGHVAALEALEQITLPAMAVNLGAGRGYSVLEMLHTFETVNGVKIPYDFVARRPGDTALYFADPGLALSALGWKAKRGVVDMCRDAWHWQQNNPNGYSG